MGIIIDDSMTSWSFVPEIRRNGIEGIFFKDLISW